MSHTEWREHDGRRYLLLAYGPDPATAPEVTGRALELIRAEPEGTVVRTLVDVSRASMSGWQRDTMSDSRQAISDLTRRYTLRTAVLGVRGPLAALMRGMSAISSGYKAIPCPNEAKALEYLMRE